MQEQEPPELCPLLSAAQVKLSARFFLLHLELCTGVALHRLVMPPLGPFPLHPDELSRFYDQMTSALVQSDARVKAYFRRVATDALMCGVKATAQPTSHFDRPRGRLMYWYGQQSHALAEAIGESLCTQFCK
jgi:hypothetical protein